MTKLMRMKKQTQREQNYKAKKDFFINVSPIINQYELKGIFWHNFCNLLNSLPLFSKFWYWSNEAEEGLNKIVLLLFLDFFISLII